MATNIVQMKDGSGNNQYPVTSAEAVGMPDGSGNLQTYLNKRVTELNISVLYPTQGIGGSNKYDLAGAIAMVPAEYRTIVGLKITFINNDTSLAETWVYNGGTFTNTTSWSQGSGSGGNKILEWNTDVATTRKQVPANERKSGLQISYLDSDDGWVNEQYIGTAFTDTEWIKDINWNKIPNQNQIVTLEAKVNRALPISNNLLALTTLTPNKFLNKDGSLTIFTSGYVTGLIPYNSEMNILYSGKYGANAVGVVFYNAANKVIGYQFENSSSVTVYEQPVIPVEGTAFIAAGSMSNDVFDLIDSNLTDTAENLKKEVSSFASAIDSNKNDIIKLEDKMPKLGLKDFSFTENDYQSASNKESYVFCPVFRSENMPDVVKIKHLNYTALNTFKNNKILVVDILDGDTQGIVSNIIDIPDSTVGLNSIDVSVELSNNQLLAILGNDAYQSGKTTNPYNSIGQAWSIGAASSLLSKKIGDTVSIGQKYGIVKAIEVIGIEYNSISDKTITDAVNKAIEEDVTPNILLKTNNYLSGKILSVTGDSEAAGHTIGVKNTYGNLIAGRNNMTINNYAQNGRKLVTGTANALVDTYQEISLDSDYILVHIGYNDPFDTVQQEIDDDSDDKTTFKGAFNVLVKGLQSRYPKARIGFITPYYFTTPGSYHKARAEWMKQRCEYYHIQCLDGTAVSGLRYDCAEQSDYFIDQVHLTALGHDRVSYIYENFIRAL